jgi:tagatose-1,6-bisphosphate aldolase non-catalytic subunit AgaZ/GatZ
MRPVYPTNDLKWGIRHLKKKVASDVLLHEMIHQRVSQTGGWVGGTSHNNERFVEEVNRIAKLLGMDIKARVFKQKTMGGNLIWHEEPGCLTLKKLFDFPYSSRTYNYYYGRH